MSDQKPCGNYHPLPCGLDKACPVPSEYCDVEKTDQEVWMEFIKGVGADDGWYSATKKPVEVEFRGPYDDPDVIETIEGDFEVDEAYIEEHGGYVIIRGVEGDVYPCGLDVFNQTYNVVGGK